MNRILLQLAFLCVAFVMHATDANPRESFGLYPVVPTKKDGATAFSFKDALTSKNYSGFYLGPALLTLSQVAHLGSGYPEAGTIPYPALFFGFTAEGFNVLRDHLKLAKPSDLVVVIDGRAYGTLDPSVVRDIVERRVKLQLLIPSALNNRGELDRLCNKLVAAKSPKK